MTTTGFIWGIIAFIIGFAAGYILKGKKNVTVLLILLFPLLTQAQDTVKSILLISDTLQIGGKINNKVVWIKGYKVLADYDTYYLDISKQRLPKNIIVWLDQNE